MAKIKNMYIIGIIALVALLYFINPLGLFSIGVGDIDQQQTAYTNSYSTITGQSFTPAHNLISKIEIYLGSAANPSNLMITLYSSPSKTSVIGTASKVVSNLGWNEFIFPSSIPLTIGNVYYFEVTGDTNMDVVMAKSGNPYSGGLFYTAGAPQSNYDMAFKTYYSAVQPQCPITSGTECTSCEKYIEVDKAWRQSVCSTSLNLGCINNIQKSLSEYSSITNVGGIPTGCSTFNCTRMDSFVSSLCKTCDNLQQAYSSGCLTSYNICKYILQTNYSSEYAKWNIGSGQCTIPVCVPDNSCAATTCSNSTCRNNCQNYIQGTKNCQLGGNIIITSINAIKSGLTITYTVNWNGGNAPYTVSLQEAQNSQWSVYKDNLYATSYSMSHTYPNYGTYPVLIIVSDANQAVNQIYTTNLSQNIPSCTSHTYSYGSCFNNSRTLTLVSSTPAGCAGGVVPQTTQSCTPTPSVCGNGVCESDETVTSCPADCSSTSTFWAKYKILIIVGGIFIVLLLLTGRKRR